MGCLRAEKIIDYLSPPLQKALQDEHPYVRKTAALCKYIHSILPNIIADPDYFMVPMRIVILGVAKLYDLKPELAIENGFVDAVKEMVRFHP